MRRFFAGAIAALFFIQVHAQDEILRAALYLSGADSEEEIDQDWIQRLEGMNRVNSGHLRPGLLTDYQIATLADYRAAHGDILSWEELMLVDGFSREAVDALRPFLSLESRRLPGAVDTVRIKAEALLRTTLKNVGAKARVSGENWRVGGAWRNPDGARRVGYPSGPSGAGRFQRPLRRRDGAVERLLDGKPLHC